MTGPLFDPSKMSVRRARQTAPGERPLTVSALAALADRVVRAGFPAKVRVSGEVSGPRERTHLYFDLKDADASVSCVMFASVAARLRFRPEEGQEVVVGGRVEYYARQGRLSLIADSIEPVGAGALDLALKRLIEELRALGYLDPARKRPLPFLPRRVGVVTSRSAAALQDVLITMRKRCPAVGVLLADVRVQGEGAAKEIAAAIDTLSRHHGPLGLDAVLVTRGGGSKEDLWAFNERAVADAIFRCRVPVVAAIGHETDVTVAELVADERCATPTHAAVRLTPDSAALGRQIQSHGRRLAAAMSGAAAQGRHERSSVASLLAGAVTGRLHDAALAAERAAAGLDRQRPRTVLARMHERLRAAGSRLRGATTSAVEAVDPGVVGLRLRRAAAHVAASAESRFRAGERQLNAVSPLRVLERGYSVTTGPDGRLVRSVGDARPGDTLRTRVVDGIVRSRVEGGQGAPILPAGVRRRAEHGVPGEPGLFGGDSG